MIAVDPTSRTYIGRLEDASDCVLIYVPDFPEVVSFVKHEEREKAVEVALDAVLCAIRSRKRDHEPFPASTFDGKGLGYRNRLVLTIGAHAFA